MDGGLGELNKQQVDAIKVLHQAEGRLERLIEDLIQFSLVARGELSLKLEAFQLEEFISVVLNTAKQKARMKNISLGIDLAQNLPPVRADREKIGWVLTQLVDNALKFTPSNGRVEVNAFLDKTRVEISVSDTGIGIPAERIAEIFEPFHQLDGSSTRKYGGTGLGLAMVRRIIEAHGSHIKVQSVEGKGSRFEFSLACEQSASAIGNLSELENFGENMGEG